MLKHENEIYKVSTTTTTKHLAVWKNRALLRDRRLSAADNWTCFKRFFDK